MNITESLPVKFSALALTASALLGCAPDVKIPEGSKPDYPIKLADQKTPTDCQIAASKLLIEKPDISKLKKIFFSCQAGEPAQIWTFHCLTYSAQICKAPKPVP